MAALAAAASCEREPDQDCGTNREAPRLIVICEYGRLTAPALRVALGDLQEVTVGRGSQRSLARQGTTATLSVPGDEISRKHLAVRRQPSGWEVGDLGSKNGILGDLLVQDLHECDKF